jgi:hypothetical protein
MDIGWKERLERYVMTKQGLEYLGSPTEQKRTQSRAFILLVNKAKQDVVKNLKEVGLLGHGRGLGLRDNEGQKKTGKVFRRKPGQWYDYFYSLCPLPKISLGQNEPVRMSPRLKVSENLVKNLHIKTIFSPSSTPTYNRTN